MLRWPREWYQGEQCVYMTTLTISAASTASTMAMLNFTRISAILQSTVQCKCIHVSRFSNTFSYEIQHKNCVLVRVDRISSLQFPAKHTQTSEAQLRYIYMQTTIMCIRSIIKACKFFVTNMLTCINLQFQNNRSAVQMTKHTLMHKNLNKCKTQEVPDSIFEVNTCLFGLGGDFFLSGVNWF